MTPSSAEQTVVHGRYRLVTKIAEGGTGEVFRAFDTIDNEWRAVKMLLPDLAKRTALRARFEREGLTMARLVHKNIAKVYEAGTDPTAETAFLVMEYAEGGSVTDWLERNRMPMPPKMAVQLTLEVCEGIQYAHEEGVIHRDIKPQNLLLDRDGTCKVSDFGIAMVSAHTRMTLTGTVMGTLGYVAPEQYESAKHTDARADVYSIAATLYTLVHGEAANHLFMADESDYAGIPKELAAVIRKGAQYQRDSRHQTVAELATDLRRVLVLMPEDPVGTPPLVPDDLPPLGEMLPPAPAPRQQTPALPRKRVTPQSPSPLNKRRTPPPDSAQAQLDNRTPSSIIPRTSLTGDSTGDKLRRPRHRTRDELERQAMLARAAKFLLAIGAIMLLALFATAMVGQVSLEGAQRREAIIEHAFIEKIETEAALWDTLSQSPHLSRGPEIRAALEQLQGETDPSRRDALVTRLSTLFEQELHHLDGRGDAVQATIKKIEQSQLRLKKAQKDYASVQEDLQEAESSAAGRLARVLLFFMD
jgi:serine/threonine protein kinase